VREAVLLRVWAGRRDVGETDSLILRESISGCLGMEKNQKIQFPVPIFRRVFLKHRLSPTKMTLGVLATPSLATADILVIRREIPDGSFQEGPQCTSLQEKATDGDKMATTALEDAVDLIHDPQKGA